MDVADGWRRSSVGRCRRPGSREAPLGVLRVRRIARATAAAEAMAAAVAIGSAQPPATGRDPLARTRRRPRRRPASGESLGRQLRDRRIGHGGGSRLAQARPAGCRRALFVGGQDHPGPRRGAACRCGRSGAATSGRRRSARPGAAIGPCGCLRQVPPAPARRIAPAPTPVPGPSRSVPHRQDRGTGRRRRPVRRRRRIIGPPRRRAGRSLCRSLSHRARPGPRQEVGQQGDARPRPPRRRRTRPGRPRRSTAGRSGRAPSRWHPGAGPPAGTRRPSPTASTAPADCAVPAASPSPEHGAGRPAAGAGLRLKARLVAASRPAVLT